MMILYKTAHLTWALTDWTFWKWFGIRDANLLVVATFMTLIGLVRKQRFGPCHPCLVL